MRPAVVTTFPSDRPEEAVAFLQAVTHNCTCQWAPFPLLVKGCNLHQDLVHDEEWLKRSVYARRLAPKLRQEEGLVA